MEAKEDMYQLLLKEFLPNEIFDFFEVTKMERNDTLFNIYLDEKNNIPKEFQKDILVSKGFHETVVIQDFPIRDKPVFLYVRRRKWLNKATGNIVSNQWDLTSKGTRYTKDFATFLKGLFG